MSIYGSFFGLDDDYHADDCAVYVETAPGVFDFSGEACDCGLERAPLIYEGSHVLPSDDDPRGGHVGLALINGEIDRPGLPAREYDEYRPWLRLSVDSEPSRYERDGKPYVPGGRANVVLTREHAEGLRDALTYWLEQVPEGTD